MFFRNSVVLFGLLLAGSFPISVEGASAKAERYHQLLLKRPGSATLLERFVDAWLDEGSKEELEEYLKESTSGGEASAWSVLASYQEWAGQEEAALAAMEEALLVKPGDPALLLARAKLRADLLDFEGALADLDAAGEAAPEEAATLRGTYLARSGKPEEAVEAWKVMLEKRPGDEELREDLIELEIGEGLYEEALATARALAESTKDPYQKALRLLRVADIEVDAGKRDEGLETYEKLLAMTGEDSWLEREVLAQVEAVFLGSDEVTGLREFYQALPKLDALWLLIDEATEFCSRVSIAGTAF
ncbi:tetratricopeptide repeat protein [Verrucomicrobiales bacterium]|nr:tetratricopeptide repeat protein [Verrucomicrobiales bacterium]